MKNEQNKDLKKYRFLKVGELVIDGDQVEYQDGWKTVKGLIGLHVSSRWEASIRREITESTEAINVELLDALEGLIQEIDLGTMHGKTNEAYVCAKKAIETAKKGQTK